MTERAIASAAATVANLGPGYDVLGLCLEGPRDRVSAELTDDGEVTIVRITGDDGRLPLAADKNCVGVAARWVLDQFGRDPSLGVRLWLDKGLPLGSGLGSSAASSVAAALATAALVDPDIPKAALLGACREGERLATGVPHADNVAPSLFGGLVACIPTDDEGIDIVRLSVPDDLVIAAVKPNYDIRTADARKVLPTHVPMADAVANVAAMAGFVNALAIGDWDVLGRFLADRLATPYRKALLPGYDAVVEAAVQAGAAGGGIAGSGSTVFALVQGHERAHAVAAAMVAAFEQAGHESMGIVSGVDPYGATVTTQRV